ncbi:MAG TPA: aminodeoxychorismate lyase [Steroidobacteraceae bacterium]|nr:aminodeoxychorismate lyase [Steroidobacteraceae bacterium]
MSGAIITWVDGASTDVVPADDRGLHYGDGLFETVLVRGGRPRFLEAHLARLASGCARLGIPFAGESPLRADIAAACARAPHLAVLKIIVTRGSATRRGYAPDAEVPRRVVSLYETPPLSPELRDGVDVVYAAGTVAEHPGLAGIKHLSRVESVWALGDARSVGAFDALLRTASGHVVSGAMTNVFAVRSGQVITPRVDRAGVAGILRQVVLRECAALGIPASEQLLPAQDLEAADEAFITNARIGVVPVRRVGEHGYRMSSLAQRLATHIEALDA